MTAGRVDLVASSGSISHQIIGITVIFALFCFCVLLVDQMCYIGYTNLNSGVASLTSAITGINNIFIAVNLQATYLKYTYPEALTASLNSAGGTIVGAAGETPATGTCGSILLGDIPLVISAYQTAADMLYELVHPQLSQFPKIQKYIALYLVNYGNIGVFVIWGLTVFTTLIFILMHALRSRGGLKFAMFLGEVVFIIVILLCVPFAFVTSLLADLCMTPSWNIVSLLPSGSLQGLVAFYSSCVGKDMLGDSLRLAGSAALSLNVTLGNITSLPAITNYTCPGNQDVMNMQTDFVKISGSFSSIADSMACSAMQKYWFMIVNDAVCGGLYNGVYSIWVSQIITSFFLFLLIVTASIAYQYFDYVQVSPEEQAEQEDAEEVQEKFVEENFDDGNNAEEEYVPQHGAKHGHGHAHGHGGNHDGGDVEAGRGVGHHENQSHSHGGSDSHTKYSEGEGGHSQHGHGQPANRGRGEEEEGGDEDL